VLFDFERSTRAGGYGPLNTVIPISLLIIVGLMLCSLPMWEDIASDGADDRGWWNSSAIVIAASLVLL